MTTLSGDSTNNILSGTSSADTISGYDGSDLILGGSGSDTIDGGAGNDVISGGSGSDSIDGGSGDDLLLGGSGSDSIDGGSGDDLLLGGSGNDVIDGGSGDDLLLGGSGNDTLTGGSGQDVLLGDSGNDILIGVEGADWMQGGAGNDMFAYQSTSDSTVGEWDRIIDFTQGKDKIDFSDLLDSTNLAWGEKSAVANGAWYLNSGSSTFVFADTNGDGKEDLKIELKNTSGLKLTVNDFIGVSEGNNAPEIASGAQSGSATEVADLASDENATLHTAAGAVSFTDADTLDTHSATFAPQAGSYLGTFALDPADSPAVTGNAVGWTFEVNDSVLDSLQDGQVLTQKYDVTVSDGHGGTAMQTVTLTLTGTNDAPTLTIADTAGALIEGDGTPTLSDSGTLSFVDLDTNDVVRVSQTYNDDIAWSGGSINPGLAAKLVAGFSVDQNSWDYSTSENLDFLGKGQTIKFSYDVVATDDSGVGNDTSVAKTVAITLTGTNDAPVAVADNGYATNGVASGNVFTNGDTDADTGDLLAVTEVNGGDFVGTLVGGTYGSVLITDTGDWTYTLDDGNLDTVPPAPDTPVDDVFTYTIDDGHGGTASTTLTIQVTGTSTAPVVTSVTNSVADLTVINNAPVAVADEANASTYGASGNVLGNDMDLDTGDSLIVTAVNGKPVEGDLSFGSYGYLLMTDAGDWGYQLNTAGVDALAQGASVDDVFGYTIADADGATASSTLTIHFADASDFIL